MAARHLELIICQSLEIPINLQSFDNIFIDLKMLYVLVDLVFIFYFFFNLQKTCFVDGIRTLLLIFFWKKILFFTNHIQSSKSISTKIKDMKTLKLLLFLKTDFEKHPCENSNQREPQSLELLQKKYPCELIHPCAKEIFPSL